MADSTSRTVTGLITPSIVRVATVEPRGGAPATSQAATITIRPRRRCPGARSAQESRGAGAGPSSASRHAEGELTDQLEHQVGGEQSRDLTRAVVRRGHFDDVGTDQSLGPARPRTSASAS